MKLVDINHIFSSENHCFDCLEMLRWNNLPCCPYCTSKRSTRVFHERRYRCNTCSTTFSVTVHTLFHHTHLPLQKWFLAVILMEQDASKISSRHLAHELDVDKKTAWYLIDRINRAMGEAPQRELMLSISKFIRNALSTIDPM